jgi:glycosyltransferase involved in cell wall biosynthesis
MRMAKLAKYLPECGWDVTVVCSDERRPEILDRELEKEIPAEVDVLRIRGPMNRIGGRATRSVAGATWSGRRSRAATLAIRAGRSILIPDRFLGWSAAVSRLSARRLGRPEVIISSGAPHSTHLAGARLAHRHGLPLVVDLRDDWAGDPFGMNVAPWQDPVNRRLEAYCLRRATRITVVNDLMRDRLAARYPDLEDRIVSIPNGFDPADVEGLRPRSPVPEGERVTFIHAGRLRDSQSIDPFYEALGRIEAETPGRVGLRLVGHVESGHLATARANLPPAALRVDPPVPHREAMELLAGSDVLVAVVEGGGAGPATMTGKIYEYLALRRPVLVLGPSGVASQLVESSGAGVAADAGDPRAVEVCLSTVVGMAQSRSFAGASESVLDLYDRRRLAHGWSALLGSVSHTGGRSLTDREHVSLIIKDDPRP